MFTDITQTQTQTIDVSRVFADLLYRNGNGIVVHDLALRIYRSEGDMELTREEESLLQTMSKQVCTPVFIDSFNENLIKD